MILFVILTIYLYLGLQIMLVDSPLRLVVSWLEYIVPVTQDSSKLNLPTTRALSTCLVPKSKFLYLFANYSLINIFNFSSFWFIMDREYGNKKKVHMKENIREIDTPPVGLSVLQPNEELDMLFMVWNNFFEFIKSWIYLFS